MMSGIAPAKRTRVSPSPEAPSAQDLPPAEEDEDYPLSNIVRLNVGGVHYDVSPDLIEESPVLFALASPDHWSSDRGAEEGGAAAIIGAARRTRDRDGRTFIDRDGETFRDVLNCLRMGPKMALEPLSYDKGRLVRLRAEADYFGMTHVLRAIDEKLQIVAPVRLSSRNWGRLAGVAWLTESGDSNILRRTRRDRTISAGTVGETAVYLLLFKWHFGLPAYRGNPERNTLASIKLMSPVTLDPEARQTLDHPYYEEQTLVECCLWDYRTSAEDRRNEPHFATATCAEIVHLRQGDELSVWFPGGSASCRGSEVPLENWPVPHDCPQHLLNSLTLIKLEGNAVARYARKREDRAVTASWRPTDIDGIDNTAFRSKITSQNRKLTLPDSGNYLVLGRAAVATASLLPRFRDGFVPGNHYARFSAISPGGRVLSKTDSMLFDADLASFINDKRTEILEHCLFHDVLELEKGTSLQFSTKGDYVLKEDQKATVPCQTLNLLQLSENMIFDRFIHHFGTWVRAHSPYHHARPSLLRVGENGGLVFSCPASDESENGRARACLVVATFSRHVEENHYRALTVNSELVALSGSPPQSCLSNEFLEIVELKHDDTINIKECYFDNGEDGWEETMYLGEKEQLGDVGHGHLAIVLLEN